MESKKRERQETDVNGICLNGICLYISEKQREREMPAQNRWLGEGVVGCVCMCVCERSRSVPKVLSLGSLGSGVLLRRLWRLSMSPRRRCLCLRLYWNSEYSYNTP